LNKLKSFNEALMALDREELKKLLKEKGHLPLARPAASKAGGFFDCPHPS